MIYLGLPGISGAASKPATPFTDLAAVAATAADRAADSGFDAVAKGPDESLVRRDVVAGSGGFHYVCEPAAVLGGLGRPGGLLTALAVKEGYGCPLWSRAAVPGCVLRIAVSTAGSGR